MDAVEGGFLGCVFLYLGEMQYPTKKLKKQQFTLLNHFVVYRFVPFYPVVLRVKNELREGYYNLMLK